MGLLEDEHKLIEATGDLFSHMFETFKEENKETEFEEDEVLTKFVEHVTRIWSKFLNKDYPALKEIVQHIRLTSRQRIQFTVFVDEEHKDACMKIVYSSKKKDEEILCRLNQFTLRKACE